MSKKYKSTNLFLLFFIISLGGLTVFIFWSDIRAYWEKNYSESLIREDAKNYHNSRDINNNNINKLEKDNQDKYDNKDKEYLEKIIKER